MDTWAELSKVQPIASKIFVNSLRENRVSHAYLIQGMRGTGKKSIANLLAMTLFCEERDSVEPCHHCHSCRRVVSGNHPDVHWMKREKKTIGKVEIDIFVKEFSYTGFESNKKMYIIPEAETLTVNAANRLLKFLEEPDMDTTAVLLTDNINAIIPTIRSRCQILDLQPLDELNFQKKLVHLQINENNARFISALTNNIDDAINYHEEEKIYKIRDIVKQMIEMMIVKYNERFLFLHQEWLTHLKDRNDLELALDIMLLAFKDIINSQIDRENPLYFFQADERLITQSVNHFNHERVLIIVVLILEAKQRLKQNVHPTLVMEDGHFALIFVLPPKLAQQFLVLFLDESDLHF